jgi:thiamine-monophosphate kinase
MMDVGEISLLRRLCRRLPNRPDVRVGAGDDCAVVRTGSRDAPDWLLTSDPVIEGIHFSRGTRMAAVGHKALGRALSDIAAMGGQPLWALVNVVVPPNRPARLLEDLYRGINRLARRTGVAVAGGDLSAGSALQVHVFAVGRVPAGRAALRSGAKAGDRIAVTGRLGGSRAGRHLRFPPRLQEGEWLRERVTAMIDLSDGLATDLRRIMEASRVGATVETQCLPLSPDARRMATSRRTALHHALFDGEDFELLVTLPAARAQRVVSEWRKTHRTPLTLIGTVTDRPGRLELVSPTGRRLLERTAYEHFR